MAAQLGEEEEDLLRMRGKLEVSIGGSRQREGEDDGGRDAHRPRS
jgi:hypothetical protein